MEIRAATESNVIIRMTCLKLPDSCDMLWSVK